MASPSDILKMISDDGYEFVDLRFCDLPGQVQHFTIPASELSEDGFDEGFGSDGSSIRGFQEIQESDMILVPDPDAALEDRFRDHKTLSLYCFVKDPVTGQPYDKDPRFVAKKAEEYLAGSGVAETSYWGPEAEFYMFDSARFDQNQHSAFYEVDSIEGAWNSGADEPGGNLAYKPRYKEGYFPVPPTDSLQDIRSEMMLVLESIGVPIECQHHEVATGGQGEIDMRFNSLLGMADNLLKYKYVIKNTARRHDKTVTFMPKPLYNDNGSGMHVHVSLWKKGRNLFAGDGYAGISETALYAIGGLLRHAPSLLAFTNPTTNSYKRLVPGFEAPVNLAYSSRNRSAAIRIPMYFSSEKAKRIEFRCPDPSCNPYLAFSAMVMAALDGIINKIHPGEPLDKDIYDLPPEELAKVAQTPGSLKEALKSLERDYSYLLKGDVFTQDVIETWIDYKMTHEVEALALRPHPWEFALYYDI